MANNRLYIACPQCGDRMFLGKYYPTHWEAGLWTPRFEHQLNEWLREHRHAHEADRMWGRRDGKAPFALVTEQDE